MPLACGIIGNPLNCLALATIKQVMKVSFTGAAICGLLMHLSCVALSQHDSLYQAADSTIHPTIITTGHFSAQNLDEMGSYGSRVADENLSHAYAGVSVFNTLRGQLPSLSISPSVVYTYGASHRGSRMIYIDGMPLSGDIAYYHNLNTFEFDGITALANPNTNFSYGSAGLMGGLFLQSKSGINKTRPSFEFNSYTSRNIPYDEPVFYESHQPGWNLSNSFAYSQDYGKVDLRASYNFNNNTYPADADLPEKDLAHSFKINGGLDLGKFSLRLIGDYRSDNWQRKNENLPVGMDGGNSTFLQANLLAQYRFNNWLKITSQHISSGTTSKTDYRYDSESVRLSTDQPRRLHNVIVNLHKPISTQVTLRSFAGVQIDRYEWTRTAVGELSQSRQHAEFANTGLLAGVGGGFAEIIFVDFNFRNDAFSVFPPDESANTWGASGSFVFSKLFADQAKFFGKLRSYFGRTSNDYHITYPELQQVLTLTQPRPSPRKNFEIGADFAMARERITFSTSYYKNVQEDVWYYYYSPFVGPTLLNLGELRYSGYEFVAGFLPVATEKTRLSSRLIFFKNKSTIGSGYDGGDPFLANSIPDWQGSWFNQLNYGSVFLNVLLDVRHGGDLYLFDTTQTPLGTVNGSHAKFRDITVGFAFGPSLMERLHLSSARVSLSGRNLIQFNDSKNDAERYDFIGYTKSLSFSLSVGF